MILLNITKIIIHKDLLINNLSVKDLMLNNLNKTLLNILIQDKVLIKNNKI